MKRNLLFSLLIYCCTAYSQSNINDTIDHLLENYQYPAALELIDKQLSIEHNDVNLYMLKGNALKGLVKYSEAIRMYETVLSIDSANYAALIEIANVHKLLGNYSKSCVYFTKAEHLSPNDIATKLEIANAKFNLENFEEASKIYLELYTKDTTRTFLLRNLARCYERIDVIDSAISCYEKFLQAYRYDYQSIHRLCNFYIRIKNYQKGIYFTEQYLRYDTTNVKINNMNAYLYLLNEKYSTAIKKFSNCLRSNDSSAFVLKYLGISYFKLEKYDTAKIYLENAFAKDSSDAKTSEFLGITCSLTNDKELGVYYFNKTICLISPPPQYISSVYLNLAEAYNGLNRYSDGLNSLLKAYEYNPTDTLIIYKIGSQYDYKIRNKDMALKYYNKFLKNRPPKEENQKNPLVISYYGVAEKRILQIKKNKW